MKLYGDTTALGVSNFNSLNNIFNRILVRDGLQYEDEPLVSGYFFITWNLPKTIFTDNQDDSHGKITKDIADNIFNVFNTKIDIPQPTITQVTIDGLGGTWNSVPGRLEVDKTFTVEFWETFNGRVMSVIRQWFFQLRSMRSGAARVKGLNQPASTSSPYAQDLYKGQCWWFLTDPNIDRIIFAIEFLGIWPTNLPINISNDIATNDKVMLSLTLSYDRFFFYPKTVTHCTNNYLKARYDQMLAIESDQGDKVGGGTTAS